MRSRGNIVLQASVPTVLLVFNSFWPPYTKQQIKTDSGTDAADFFIYYYIRYYIRNTHKERSSIFLDIPLEKPIFRLTKG